MTKRLNKIPDGINLLSIRHIAYGQNNEDIVLLRAFKDIRNGYYIDVGAGHPVEGSITKNLYDQLGWTGLEIEPLPEMADLLRLARPKNTIVSKAVGATPGTAIFYRLTDNWGMSTLDPHVAQLHKNNGWAVTKQTVKIDTLNRLLDKHVKCTINFLKLDIEGCEGTALTALDLSKWQPWVLMIEATAPASTRSTHQTWEKYILDSGYTLALFDGLNRFYVRKDKKDILDLLKIPANIFDGYIPYK